MTRMVIWDLPTFCRFYGRVKPYNLNEDKFNELTASKMEEDVDTHIIFDKSLEPMTFMNMLALSRGLFVVGYGNPVDCWGKHTSRDIQFTMNKVFATILVDLS